MDGDLKMDSGHTPTAAAVVGLTGTDAVAPPQAVHNDGSTRSTDAERPRRLKKKKKKKEKEKENRNKSSKSTRNQSQERKRQRKDAVGGPGVDSNDDQHKRRKLELEPTSEVPVQARAPTAADSEGRASSRLRTLDRISYAGMDRGTDSESESEEEDNEQEAREAMGVAREATPAGPGIAAHTEETDLHGYVSTDDDKDGLTLDLDLQKEQAVDQVAVRKKRKLTPNKIEEDSEDESSDEGEDESSELDSESPVDDDAGVLDLEEVRNLLRTCPIVDTAVQPKGVPRASIEIESVPDGGNVKGTQQDVAKELAAKMVVHIQDAIQQRGRAFSRLAFYIFLPKPNSLAKQTVVRLAPFLAEYSRYIGDDSFFADVQRDLKDASGKATSDSRFIIRPSAGGEDQAAKVKALQNEIQNNPDTLFLIIQDEAHYDMTATGEFSKIVNGQELREPANVNVLTLFVSATPYCIFTRNSQIPARNVCTMSSAQHSASKRYYGIADYCNKDHIGQWGEGRMTSDDDFDRLWRDADGKSDADKRVETMLQQYKSALIKHAIIHRNAFGKLSADTKTKIEKWTSKFTDNMIADLLKPAPSGKGSMILIRVDSKPNGAVLHAGILKAQKELGLQDSFATILDTDQRNTSLKDLIKSDVLKKRLASWAIRIEDPHAHLTQPQTIQELCVDAYEELEGLPCILILCQKGKMGDTFPRSMKYYDLRLKYYGSGTKAIIRAPAEQDLGRACRWVDKHPNNCATCRTENDGEPDDYERKQMPYMLVSSVMIKTFKQGRKSTGNPVLRRQPDRVKKMVKVPEKDIRQPPGHSELRRGETNLVYYHPLDDFDTETYRTNWDAGEGNADYKPDDPAIWRDNPSRFALVGRPQIGKTGVFLHLIYLLYQVVQPPAQSIDIPTDDSDHSEDDSDDERPGAAGDKDSLVRLSKFPNYRWLKDMKFDKSKHRPSNEADGRVEMKLKDVVFEYPELRGTCIHYQNHLTKLDDVQALPAYTGTNRNRERCEFSSGGCTKCTPSCGKYGDPKALCLWTHNIGTEGEPWKEDPIGSWEKHPDEHKFKTPTELTVAPHQRPKLSGGANAKNLALAPQSGLRDSLDTSNNPSRDDMTTGTRSVARQTIGSTSPKPRPSKSTS
eukprot:COSAG02_NODE_4840_length_4918_cov_35.030712_1_plen_1132_part_10